MQENFIGYLLDALDERSREQVEIYLRQHPEAREKLALLRQALTPLAADKETSPPPPQLVLRTLARIAEHACSGGAEEAAPEPRADLPHAPPVSTERFSEGRTWWRRADVLVAACVLFIVGGIGLMVLGRLRDPRSPAVIADCRNNLMQFFTALHQYRDTRGQFPDVTREMPRHVAGMVVPMLLDAGTLTANASVRCPGNGSAATCQIPLNALRTMSDEEFSQLSPCLSASYAYSLGYQDENGVFHGPGTQPDVALSQLPIMADCPPTEPGSLASNSLNHGGKGQNILFGDGHVVFLSQRKYGGNEDDIFLNSARKVAAGVGAGDIVLGASSARP